MNFIIKNLFKTFILHDLLFNKTIIIIECKIND